MSALLSLPRLPTRSLRFTPQVPPSIRARAGQELRRAVQNGKIEPGELARALSGGDAGVATLMARRHRLCATPRIDWTLDSRWHVSPEVISNVLAWAASLRDAGRIAATEVAAIPRTGGAFAELATLCAHASMPQAAAAPLPALPCQPATHPVLAVSPSFLPMYDYGVTGHDAQASPKVIVEVINSPFSCITLPTDPDDARALASAIEAVRRADPVGLFFSPQDTLWAADPYLTDMVQDIATTCARHPDGTPDLKPQDLEVVIEEMGYEPADAEKLVGSFTAHVTYLDRLFRDKLRWPPGGKAMQSWLQSRRGQPTHAVVKRLLAVAGQLRKLTNRIPKSMSDSEGDAVGVFVVENPPTEAEMALSGLDSYGNCESPVRSFQLDGEQNATSFWQLYECVVMAASLVTDAAHAITSIDHRSQAPEGSTTSRLAA